MADRELRELERRWRESGAEHDRRGWLQARSRTSGVSVPVLLTQDALRDRGLDWALGQLEVLATAHAVSSREELRAVMARLGSEAFGPLVPSADYVLGGTQDAEGFLRFATRFVRVAHEYVLTLERHAREWGAGQPNRAAVAAALATIEAQISYTEDAWYWGVGGLVEEFCEIVGEPPPKALDDLVEACFSSWVLGEGEATRFGNAAALGWVRSRFEDRYGALPQGLAEEWVPIVPAGDAREALLPHLQTSLEMDWEHPPATVAERLCTPAFRETRAQERYQEIDGLAHGDDATREARFAAALEHARAVADGAQAMTFDVLTEIQARVLGREAPVRSQPALAKGGAEVYAWFRFLDPLVTAKVAADLQDRCHPIVRAARLYLDLIYTHPFDDGNGRAARLALELVLRRAGLPTPDLEPVERCPKQAGVAERYWEFVVQIADGVRRASAV